MTEAGAEVPHFRTNSHSLAGLGAAARWLMVGGVGQPALAAVQLAPLAALSGNVCFLLKNTQKG